VFLKAELLAADLPRAPWLQGRRRQWAVRRRPRSARVSYDEANILPAIAKIQIRSGQS